MRAAALALAVAGSWLAAPGAAADTLRVVTHRGVTVPADPAPGARSHARWGVFPGRDAEIRTAEMRVTLACPESLQCGDDAGADRIAVRRAGGSDRPPLDYDIGRLFTPYGGEFTPGWSHTWTLDVTDFSLVLRDSVEIDYVHAGEAPAGGRGWAVTIEFLLVAGPPAAAPLSITRIHDGVFGPGDRTIGSRPGPVAFAADELAAFARLLVTQTGHGDGDRGCAGSCDRYRTIAYDGRPVERKRMIRECAGNALWPQAGAWIHDRMNRCPGGLEAPDAYDLPVVAGGTHTVTIDFEPDSLPGRDARVALTAYIVQYAAPPSSNDAAVARILVPTAADAGRRSNPACDGARAAIRNNGSDTLRSMIVRYGTLYFDDRSLYWKGAIPPLGTEIVDLPGVIPQRVGANTFRVRVYAPNDAPDEWPADDEMVVPFEATPAYASPVIFHLLPNLEPGQTSYTLTRGDGTVLRSAPRGSLSAGVLVRDTLRLDPGCYTLSVEDSAGDGLAFRYNPRGGAGTARLFDARGRLLEDRDPDFGNGTAFRFRITENFRLVSEPAAAPVVRVFPALTLGATTLEVFSNDSADVLVRIESDPGGETVAEHLYPGLRRGTFTYDLGARGPARYDLKVYRGGALVAIRRIRVVESLE